VYDAAADLAGDRAKMGLHMADRETALQTVTFKNNLPVIGWIGAPVMVAAVTYTTYGGVFGPSEWVIGRPATVAVWLLGIGIALWMFRYPRTTVTVGRGGVVARDAWLWRARESRHAAADLSVPDVVEKKGSEGEVGYQCFLRLPNGRLLTVAEVTSRERAEEVRGRLLAALGSG
jgi:hypothetical protein